MKLLLPIKSPAKNTEQKIFKIVLLVILPLLAALTVYSFVSMNTKKDDFARNLITTQGGNANKRISMFLDPISRDIGYLQTLGTEKELDPSDSEGVQKTLTYFSSTHLQQVQHVIFWDGENASVYAVSKGQCEPLESTLSPEHSKFLDDTLNKADPSMIDWSEGVAETSLMAAMFFNAQKPYTVATDINATDFFEGLKNYMEDRLFLLSDQQEQLPRQFCFSDGDEQRPDIVVSNDDVIISVYTQWKNSSEEKRDITHRIIFNGKPWWVSIRPLQIKNLQLYSGFILPEAQVLENFFKSRRNIILISSISFLIVLIATAFLWRRFQQDIVLSALPPSLNKMDDTALLQTIAEGEGDRLEFKSTMRWNLHTNKPDKAMEIACLKSIAAFLNSDGGTLLVGVEDDGNILGIEADQFPNEDKYLLHFNNLINQHLGLENADNFSFDIRNLEKGNIMIVDCLPSPAPVYLTHDRKEEFYVRIGPGTRPLTTRDAPEYIGNHF